jgi:cell division protein FtsB
MTLGRWAAIAGLVSALYFALQGGEYSTSDLLQLRREEEEEQATIIRLKDVVDSLAAVARGIEQNPKVQERVARERFGMLRKGEFLYRLVPAEKPVSGER